MNTLVAIVRALFVWLVIFAALLLLLGQIGPMASLEVLLVLAISIGLTVGVLRAWDRSRARRAGSARSV